MSENLLFESWEPIDHAHEKKIKFLIDAEYYFGRKMFYLENQYFIPALLRQCRNIGSTIFKNCDCRPASICVSHPILRTVVNLGEKIVMAKLSSKIGAPMNWWKL